MRIQADIERVAAERAGVERALRELRGRLEVFFSFSYLAET